MLIRVLRTYLRPYGQSITLMMLLQLVQTVAYLLLPTMNADIIDNGLVNGSVPYILHAGVLMLAVVIVQVVSRIGAEFFGARTAMALGRDVRKAVFRRVQDFSVHEIDRFGTASLTTRTLNDVQQLQMVTADGFSNIVAAPIMFVFSIVLALQQDVPLTLILAVFIPLSLITVSLLMARMSSLYDVIQTRMDRMNRILREQITGVRVVRAFVRDTHEQERFGAANTELFQSTLRARRLAGTMFPMVWLLGNVATVAVVWIGGPRVATGDLQVGALSAFIGYLMLILRSMLIAMYAILTVPRARVSAGRIQEVLDTAPSVARPAAPVGSGRMRGHLDLRGVGFRYPGAEEPSLRDIDLTARPGETLAIVGSTGGGKTTLMNLVARLSDATTGVVLVNGVNVRELDPTVLCQLVAVVPQKPYLFAGTVATNLRYGRPEASDVDLWHALHVTQARDFVKRMPGGLDAEIAQGGANLSGGQRQRLTIARALLRRAEIYLFDDCFSGLDYSTDAALRAAIAPDLATATVIVVAQRVSTVREVHRIAVLDEGRIVGLGKHEELMNHSETYREIVYSQLTRQEAM